MTCVPLTPAILHISSQILTNPDPRFFNRANFMKGMVPHKFYVKQFWIKPKERLKNCFFLYFIAKNIIASVKAKWKSRYFRGSIPPLIKLVRRCGTIGVGRRYVYSDGVYMLIILGISKYNYLLIVLDVAKSISRIAQR